MPGCQPLTHPQPLANCQLDHSSNCQRPGHSASCRHQVLLVPLVLLVLLVLQPLVMVLQPSRLTLCQNLEDLLG